MALKNIEELNGIQLDVLTELGNIGSGNAATSISNFMNKPININIPKVRILGFNEVAEYVGGPENITLGLLIKMSSDINGMILYLFNEDFIKNILDIFFGKEYTSFSELSELEISAVQEIGNIMAGSYVNALSSMTGMTIDISAPSVCIDMAGAILSVPSIEFAKIGNKVLFIDDSFGIGTHQEQQLKSNMILIPEMDSLNKLFTTLGVLEC